MFDTINSLTNKNWRIMYTNAPSSCEHLLNILLANREITDTKNFFNPSLRHFMPDPFNFIDMEKAVIRVAKAIQNDETITIFGDYDVDGVVSTSLLIKFFEYAKVPYQYVIPNRVDDGYGVSKRNIDKYKNSLIIAVDCGCNAIEELTYAKENEVEIIVIDHHKMDCIPEAVAIINPHRPDECGKYKYLCAAGLVFIFIVGLNRELKRLNFYEKEPDLISYLDIVAIATVCDVMELVDLNRAFVSTGIKVIKKRQNLGINALISVGNINDITSEVLAFFLGPRINAAGRLSYADISVKLLTTKDIAEAQQLALHLDELNQHRKVMESEIIADAQSRIDHKLNFICLYSHNWHAGIIGIIAGRIKETYNKPAFIIACDSNGIGKASCRSVEGIDVAAIIRKAINTGIIISGGGHKLAAGFLIKEEKIADFIEFLKSEIKEHEHLRRELIADCLMPIELISNELINEISKLEPFGEGNHYPKFVIPRTKIISRKIVGENHIQVVLSDDSGRQLRAISFKSTGTPLGYLLMNKTDNVSVLGTISVSKWSGKNQINFRIEDISTSLS